MSLPQLPYRGRLQRDGAFAWVLPTVPRLVLYDASDDPITIVGIHHTAQNIR